MPVIGWRKKGGRISELVANHLHSSPKRGRSLVVETGFPTSLIDLFVKNRDRFQNNNNNKKYKNKKQKQRHHDQAHHHHHDLVMLTSSQTPSPTPDVSVSVSDSSNPYLNLNLNLSSGGTGTGTGTGNGNGIADEILSKVVDGGNNNKVVGVGDIDDVVDEDGGDATNGVLVCVIKMSLLVILALSTKKFAVGLTISALLLIFLEYLGQRVCKHFQKSLGGSLIQLVLGFLTSVVKRQKLVTQQNLITDSNKSPVTQEESVVWGCCSCSTEGGELNIPNEEIQILQPNCNMPPPIEGIQWVKLDEFQTLGGVDKKEEGHFGCGVIEPKARQSRGAKIKSNIKNLVPKKLRSTKKKKRKDLENEETSSLGQDKVAKCEEQRQEADWERSSLFSSGRCCAELLGVDEDDEERVVAVARTDVVENVVPKEVLAVERERLSETKRNTGYLIFFLIVLGGLVGGRVLALLLTLLWCFMIKSAAKFRRYDKVPVDWFPVKNL